MPDPIADTRRSYDAIAVDYAARYSHELVTKPLDRAVLAAFAQIVGPGARVLDVGCGPGRVTAALAAHGLDVCGVDLSPGMLAVARAEYPGLDFREGCMTRLEVSDATLAGLVAWYSLIHLPDELLPAVFDEFHRVLAPGGHLLMGFQVGDEPKRYTEAFGHPVALEFRRLQPDRIAELAESAGFSIRMRLVRAPEPDEPTPQAHLLASKD
jgi:ubiquinone/menaquinone biosynthesis C-methylase UbiE